MATNLRTEDLPFASVTPMRILAGLYRSTFVDKIQERFRMMLAGAYAVYVTALGEGFDPALRAHLTDILQDIIARTAELTDVFEEELMGHFRVMLEQSGNLEASEKRLGEVKPVSRPDVSPRLDTDPAVQEFITKTIRSIETRHGSIILAVTRVYVKLVGQTVEDFRPPWTPAYLFSAFATVLERIDVPIHEKVKLALYRMFSQEVLRYLGDACLAFRDVLPPDLAQLNLPRCESAALFASETAADGTREPNGNGAGNVAAAAVIPKLVLAGAEKADRYDTEHDGEEGAAVPPEPEARTTGKLGRALLILLGGLGIVCGGWWAGTYYAKAKFLSPLSSREPVATADPTAGSEPEKSLSESVPANRAAPDQLPGKTTGYRESSPSTQMAAPEQRSAVEAPAPAMMPDGNQPLAGADARQKREIMHSIRLKTFAWRVDSGSNEMLFDLTIANTGKVRIGGIEVVCSQYSTALDFLEAAKTVLAEAVEPGQSKAFKAVPIGFPSKQTERVNCVIADAVPVPVP
jgi:hypothetical protein